jgi:prepilin-type N-terminal cleavage/methylation domain-containing protein
MHRPRRALRGMTLIELMIVVAILSVLALIAIPKFGAIIRRANEAGTKGHLGSIRGAIRLYYMEHDQIFPSSFSGLLTGNNKYLSGTSTLYTGVHPLSDLVDDVLNADPLSDAGRWGYVRANEHLGDFWIQCIHTDSSGRVWSAY